MIHVGKTPKPATIHESFIDTKSYVIISNLNIMKQAWAADIDNYLSNHTEPHEIMQISLEYNARIPSVATNYKVSIGTKPCKTILGKLNVIETSMSVS